ELPEPEAREVMALLGDPPFHHTFVLDFDGVVQVASANWPELMDPETFAIPLRLEPFEPPDRCKTMWTWHWYGEDGRLDPLADPYLSLPTSDSPQSVLMRVFGADGASVEAELALRQEPEGVCGGDLTTAQPTDSGVVASIAELTVPFTIEFQITLGQPVSGTVIHTEPVAWPEDFEFPFELPLQPRSPQPVITLDQAVAATEEYLNLLARGEWQQAADHARPGGWSPEELLYELADAIDAGAIPGGIEFADQLQAWCGLDYSHCDTPFEILGGGPADDRTWELHVEWPGIGGSRFLVIADNGINVVGLPIVEIF
ncbi:MAG: hypothetical protein GY926_18335, partial [bacterium]|nr:hypothetical protein [bacterium]